MRSTALNTRNYTATDDAISLFVTPDLTRVAVLTEADREEALAFLCIRPVHTVVMTSFILDNGMESPLNRGKFYGYRGATGNLEGVALIGHTTLVESRSVDALKAIAITARQCETSIHLIMSDGRVAEAFWSFYAGVVKPRLKCTEVLFETAFPMPVQECEHDLRPATIDELLPVAEAQAEIAFVESGVDPMLKDREGFLARVARRIEMGRVFVVVENGEMIFKADIISETPETAYLEGIYVAPGHRGKGVAPRCLSRLTMLLLDRVSNVCMLSNVDFDAAHRSYVKAGFRAGGRCTTLFV